MWSCPSTPAHAPRRLRHPVGSDSRLRLELETPFRGCKTRYPHRIFERRAGPARGSRVPPAGGRDLVYPASFEYVAPTTLDDAFAHLDAHGDDGKVLAGGQSLIPLMKLRFAAPAVLVDI